jgi:hypothetical protein
MPPFLAEPCLTTPCTTDFKCGAVGFALRDAGKGCCDREQKRDSVFPRRAGPMIMVQHRVLLFMSLQLTQISDKVMQLLTRELSEVRHLRFRLQRLGMSDPCFEIGIVVSIHIGSYVLAAADVG